MVQTVHVAHMPASLALYAAVYTDVENAAFLKSQLLAGNTEFEYAFIDASMVISTTHVLAAAFRAMNDYLNERLKSRNIHSEIVFALSPNNNIGEAFRRFGISETTRDLLVLKVATSPEVTLESVGAHLAANVQGVECAFDDEVFRKVADVDRVRKVYKISSAAGSTRKGAKGVVDPLEISGSNSGSGSGSGSGNSQDIDKLQVQVLGLMALRGAT